MFIDQATLAATVGYHGAGFNGFAKQKDQSLRTVQGELEHALAVLFRRDVPLVCAGRTDAGVHARGQVVSFDLERSEFQERSLDKTLISLNALTPDDIVVKDVREVPPGFSARFDAVRREYRYRIVTGAAAPVFLHDFAWWRRGDLDIRAMGEGAGYLIGEHDFKSFCKSASAQGKTTMRFVEAVDIFEEEQLGETCLCIRVVGNAFLHSMVRTMVGTLVQVGAGNRVPEWIKKVLEARDRAAAGETAPAQGLTFWRVTYPQASLNMSLPQGLAHLRYHASLH